MSLTKPAWHDPLCIGCGVRHAEDQPCPDGTRWWRGEILCTICGNEYVAVVPLKIGQGVPTNLECPRCGSGGDES